MEELVLIPVIGLDLTTGPVVAHHALRQGGTEEVEEQTMHPMLMTHIAQEDVAERLRSIERERLARMAKASQGTRAAASRSGALAGLGEALHRYLVALRTAHRPDRHRATTPAPCLDVKSR